MGYKHNTVGNIMVKKQIKITKEETLENILFNCRNSLRGRVVMTDKRDLLLTLVFFTDLLTGF